MSRSISQQSTMDPIITTERTEEKAKTTWRDYIEITKPGINKSNLFATFTGYWLAAGFTLFNLTNLILILLGTAFLIAGGCTLNNYYDRDIDPLMERTKGRPVPMGKIKPIVAFWYGLSLTIMGLCILFIGVNPLTALLGLIGFVIYVMVYTLWLKRVSTLNTVIGGTCGAIPPMMGWVGVTNEIDLTAWALFLILFMWQPPHFFALAMLRVKDYQVAGIPMLPVIKGFIETKRQILFFTILLVFSSFILFFNHVSGWFYFFIALILGTTYIGLSLRGFFVRDDSKWARQMFLYSLIYLPILMFGLIIDVILHEWLKI